MLGLSSSGVTMMLSFTRVGLIFSTVVVTLGVSDVLMVCDASLRNESGRQDSNLRPPAPKAGALPS